jgi:imidazolonepropionase
MQQLIINIGNLAGIRKESTLLRGAALAELQSINNAFLLIENGLIKDFGGMQQLETENSILKTKNQQSEIIDANNSTILPCWVDSHTHLVFAESREEEFVDKIKGKTYAEIAAKGGGILNSCKKIKCCFRR